MASYSGDVIPSFYSQASASGLPFYSGGAWRNDQLRQGEVKKVIPPSSEESRSKLFYEYDVLVAHRANDGVVNKLYHNCFLSNSFAGLADKCYYTLRASDIQDGTAKGGHGSRVLLLCLDGNENQAFILGGIKSPQDPDKDKGHHLVFEFNGVLFEVNDDGSWTLTNKGKTNLLGGPDKDRNEDGAGTQVKVESNGNFQVSTPNSQTIKVDCAANTITIDSSSKVTINTNKADIHAAQINLGAAPTFSNVLGEPLVAVLSLMCSTIGPTLPTIPQRAAITAAASQLSTILSSSVKVQG